MSPLPEEEDEAAADLEGDQEYLQQADRYEASYNFRFEVRLVRESCCLQASRSWSSCVL